MKSLIVTFILLTQFGFSQAQVGFDGFGDIRIGKSYKELKKKITTVEEVPEYAWFSPLTIDFFMFEYGLDSTDALARLEESQAMDEEEMEDEPEVRTIMCSFKKKNDQTIAGLNVECAKLVFNKDILIAIMVVINPEKLSRKVKADFLNDLSLAFGETSCSYSIAFDDPPFYCGWDSDAGERLIVSDMLEPGFGPGESINLTFGN
ncbi:MAG: hypothetical protein HRT58_22605 [Crocinitomicaceae bacterium]|nr:hypothetical protein [Flavobacteriales bacterium]NQZ38470.1 hypothetical protein [Crocinitomicaceae bacterium]